MLIGFRPVRLPFEGLNRHSNISRAMAHAYSVFATDGRALGLRQETLDRPRRRFHRHAGSLMNASRARCSSRWAS